MAKLRLNPGLVPNLKWEYEVTEVGAIHCVGNSTQHKYRLRQVIKLLILHSCFRFISELKNMRNLIRFYRVVQCLRNWHVNNTVGLKRGDYIAKRCDTLNNDQLMNCERQLSH